MVAVVTLGQNGREGGGGVAPKSDITRGSGKWECRGKYEGSRNFERAAAIKRIQNLRKRRIDIWGDFPASEPFRRDMLLLKRPPLSRFFFTIR